MFVELLIEGDNTMQSLGAAATKNVHDSNDTLWYLIIECKLYPHHYGTDHDASDFEKWSVS